MFMERLSLGFRVDVILFCLVGFTVFTSYSAEGKANFTSTPASKVYTLTGRTAKLTWTYTFENRTAEFQDRSPTWELYFLNRTSVQLAYENKNTRTWNLSSTCPSRLRDRLRIELPSSLTIKNANTNDSGVYGCTLRLVSGQFVTSRVELIITDPPVFTNLPPKQVQQPEGSDLKLLCSVRSTPSSTVTWLRVIGKQKLIKSKGPTGNAELIIRNIRREEEGTYECQASNNPSQEPIINQTVIIVTYRPSINLELSSPVSVSSWDNHIVNLRCMASGNPTPQIQWTGPDNNRIIYGVSGVHGGGLLTVQTKDSKDYGQYRCKAINSRGYDYLHINVIRIVLPGPPVISAITSTVYTIELTWSRPTLNGGSPVIDYKISIDINPLRTVSVRGTSVVLAGLIQNTEYNVTIFARNIVGYGNASSTLVTTKQRGASQSSTSASTVLAVCLPIIVILVLVIIAIVVYNWWKWRKRKELHRANNSTNQDDESPRETDAIKLEEGQQKENGSNETPYKNYNGSCFQPFMKRPRRRPGQPRQQPRPLEILDPITEENPDEESIEESRENEPDQNENIQEESELEVIIEPKQEETESQEQRSEVEDSKA